MTLFFQAAACVLVTVVLCCLLNGQDKSVAALLAMAACVLVMLAAISYLQPVIELIETLCADTQIPNDMLTVLLKVIGVGLITELTVLICIDSGNAAVGRTIEILAVAAIFWLAIPLIQAFLELLQTILGEL